MGKLENKVAIVTGATSGMGRAIAELFAREGAAVIVGGRNRERGDEVVGGIRAEGGNAELCLGDISTCEGNEALVQKAVAAFGGVDILVPNAGSLGLGSVTEVPLETWRETIATNLDAVFFLARLGIPEMHKRGGGSIVVNGSIAAFHCFPNHPAYCASKGALIPLVKQIAIDYGPEIRINLICPAQVDTPLLRYSARAFPEPDKIIQEVADGMPMKRIGVPEDIAKAALFLASDDASWITGTALTIDGGAMCGG